MKNIFIHILFTAHLNLKELLTMNNIILN